MRRLSLVLSVFVPISLTQLAAAQTPEQAGPTPQDPEAQGSAAREPEAEGPEADNRSGEGPPPTAESQSTVTGFRNHFAQVNNQPGGLTSAQAAQAAAELSPDAQAAQAQVESADAQVNQVVWQYLPRLTLTARYTRLSPQPATDDAGFGGSLVVTDQTQPGPLDPMAQLLAVDATSAFQQIQDQWYLNAGLVVPVSDYIFNVRKAIGGAKTARHAAALTEKAERVTAAANARIAYYNWVGARLQAREAGKSVERAQKQLETLKAQFEAGRTSRADVLRADAFLAEAQLDQERAQTNESIAREKLNVLMTGGQEAQPSWEIGEDLLTKPKVRPEDNKSIKELQKEAMQNRLELRALRETQQAMGDQAAVERTQAYPRIEGFANATYANPNQRIIPQTEQWAATWDVGIRMVWTLNEIGMKSAAAKKTEADLRELQAQERSIEHGLRNEVLTAYRQEQEARLAARTATRGLEAAEAAYQDRQLLYENGRATSLDLLEAETSLVSARLNLVQSLVSLKNARVRLDHALGRDVPTLYPHLDAETN